GTATVVVRNHDGYESHGSVTILPSAPGIFTEKGDGTGAAVALEATTLLRTPFDPVDEQNNPRRLIIFATGMRHAANVSVTIGGRRPTVQTITPLPEPSRLDQLNVVFGPHIRR